MLLWWIKGAIPWSCTNKERYDSDFCVFTQFLVSQSFYRSDCIYDPMFDRRALSRFLLPILVLVLVFPGSTFRHSVSSRSGVITTGDLRDKVFGRAGERQSTEITAKLPRTVLPGEQYRISGLLFSTASHTRLSGRTVKLFLENELLSSNITGREGFSLGRFEFDLIIDRSPGDYSVTVVFGGDENLAYSQLKQVVTVESSLPDIVVNNKHILVEPDIPVTNSSVSIECIVRNIGGGNSWCKVSFYQDRIAPESLICQSSVNVPGKNRVVVPAVWRAVPGDHVIWISAEATSSGDVDPCNNLAYKHIYVDPVDNDSWPMFGYDICRSGHTGFPGPGEKTLAWFSRDINIGGYTAAKSSPAVYGDRVVIGGDTGKVTSFHKFTGEKLWEFRTGDDVKGVHSSPTIYDGRVFFGSYDHNVYALDLATGEKIWSYDTGGWVGSSPAIFDGKLFIGSDVGYRNGQFIALDVKDGTLIWAFNSTGDIHSSPAVDPVLGTVYVGSNDNRLYALDMNGSIDGNRGVQDIHLNGSDLIWNFTTGNAIKASPAVDPDTHIVYVPSWDGYVYALNGSDGELVWKRYITPYLYSSPALYEDCVIVAGYRSDGAIHAFRKDNGEEMWTHDTGGYAIASPTIAADTLYLGLKGNDILALDMDRGVRKWHYNNYANVTASCAVSSKMTFVASDSPEGILYAFGRPTSIIDLSSRDMEFSPRYPLAGQPFSLEMTLRNSGTRNCGINVRIRSKPAGAMEDEYVLLETRELSLEPWNINTAAFQFSLEDEGMYDISVEIERGGEGRTRTGQEISFIYGRNITLSANISGDADEDGMPDLWEREYGLDPVSLNLSGDLDGDGLTDLGEYWEHTRPDRTDTDLDGLGDWAELDMGSSPVDPDSDGDGIPDGWEYCYNADPLGLIGAGDNDADGLTNLDEYMWHSDPVLADTDSDGMPDGWEVGNTFWNPAAFGYVMDPRNASDPLADTDDDGFDHDEDGEIDEMEALTNLEEFYFDTDPSRVDSDHNGVPDGRQLFEEDMDDDGMTNGWEEVHYLDPLSGADRDWDDDGDGISNFDEWIMGYHPTDPDMDDDDIMDGHELEGGTDPRNNDTDDDGMPDGWETANGLDPLDGGDGKEDGDLDRLTNREEYEKGTDPGSRDSDDDGIMDGRDEAPTNFDPVAVLTVSIDSFTELPSGETVPTVRTGVSVEFNASLSQEREEIITHYYFILGDGNISGWTNSSSVFHSYSKAGLYSVELRVKNDKGGMNPLPTRLDIFISNRLPVLEVGPVLTETLTLEPVSVDLSGIRDIDGLIENVSILWGDGNVTYPDPVMFMKKNESSGGSDELVFVHWYADDGLYDVGITARDDEGGTNTTNFTIRVMNRPPVPHMELPDTIYRNEEITFNARPSIDHDGKIVEYVWKFEDGRMLRGDNITLSFEMMGMNTVTLSLRDDDGGAGEVTKDFFVNPARKGPRDKDGMDPGREIMIYAPGLLLILLIIAMATFELRRRSPKRTGKKKSAPGRMEFSRTGLRVRRKKIRKRIVRRVVAGSMPGEDPERGARKP